MVVQFGNDDFFDNKKKATQLCDCDASLYWFQMNNVDKQDEHQNCYKEQWDRGRDELMLKQTYIVKNKSKFQNQ